MGGNGEAISTPPHRFLDSAFGLARNDIEGCDSGRAVGNGNGDEIRLRLQASSLRLRASHYPGTSRTTPGHVGYAVTCLSVPLARPNTKKPGPKARRGIEDSSD